MIRRRRQRGNFLVVAAAALAAAAVLSASLRLWQSGEFERRREAQTDANLREAERALLNYFLIENVRLGAEKIQTQSKTRPLQLPCPDNIGDDNLDGAQDPACGGGGENITKDALASGSRFGRLPWRTASSALGGVAYTPGLDLPHLRDGFASRFWYALAYNVAPKQGAAEALNLHSLADKKDGWLLVRDKTAAPIADRVLAVVLAPHKPVGGRARFDEDVLAAMALISVTVSGATTTTITLTVAATVAANYFEELVFTADAALTFFAPAAGGAIARAAGETITLSNFDGDGEFVYAPLRTTATLTLLSPDGAVLTTSLSVMDDRIGYLTLDEMLDQDGGFLPRFERLLGANREIQNLPLADSPLSRIVESLRGFRAAFGFYPIPAAMTAANLTALRRGCGLNELAEDAPVTLAVGAQLVNLRPLSINAAGTGEVTITLTAAAPMRAVEEVVVVGDADIVSVGQTINNAPSPTLAAGARVVLPAPITLTIATTLSGTLPAGATVAITTTLTSSSPVTASVLAAVYATVTVDESGGGETTVTIAGYPQWKSPNPAHGLFPEHAAYSMTAVRRDGDYRTFAAGAEGRFLSSAELTLSAGGATITIRPHNEIAFPPGARMRVSEGVTSAVDLDGYLSRANFPAAISVNGTIYPGGARPTPDTFINRDFAILIINADISVGAAQFIPAPAVIYPWRKKEGESAISRDNLNRWPPCWDAREFSPAAQRMVENFPLYYAVAADCLPGGKCGGGLAGLTVTVAPRTTFALPSPYTITATATFPPPFVLIADPSDISAADDPEEKLEIEGTVYRRTRSVSGGTATTSLPDGMTIYIPRNAVVSLDALSAVATLAQAIAVTTGDFAVLPAQTPLASTAALRIENAEALLIFSPAPLPRRVSCAQGAETVIFSQTRAYAGENCDDLEPMDLYLEEEENRNFDAVFFMERFLSRPRPPGAAVTVVGGVTTTVVGAWREPVNDFFIVFGGGLSAP